MWLVLHIRNNLSQGVIVCTGRDGTGPVIGEKMAQFKEEKELVDPLCNSELTNDNGHIKRPTYMYMYTATEWYVKNDELKWPIVPAICRYIHVSYVLFFYMYHLTYTLLKMLRVVSRARRAVILFLGSTSIISLINITVAMETWLSLHTEK